MIFRERVNKILSSLVRHRIGFLQFSALFDKVCIIWYSTKIYRWYSNIFIFYKKVFQTSSLHKSVDFFLAFQYFSTNYQTNILTITLLTLHREAIYPEALSNKICIVLVTCLGRFSSILLHLAEYIDRLNFPQFYAITLMPHD